MFIRVTVVFMCCVAFQAQALSWEGLDDAMTTLDAELEEGSIVGAGVLFPERPYKGVDDDAAFVPIAIAEWHQFFIAGTVLGYYFNEPEEVVRFGVIAGPHFGGYEADDSSDLTGMQDREWGFDAGVRMTWKNTVCVFTADVVSDISATHDGQEVRLSLSKELFKGFLRPRLGMKWQSKDLVDYYYGVTAREARAGRGEYIPGSEFEYSAGLTIAVPLGETLAAIVDAQGSFLGDEVTDSPIVGEDTLMRYVVGVVYRF